MDFRPTYLADPGRTAEAMVPRRLTIDEYRRCVRAYYEAMEVLMAPVIATKRMTVSRNYIFTDGTFQDVRSPEQDLFDKQIQELAAITAAQIFKTLT